MRKIFILLLACCPLLCAAQTEWETPDAVKAKEAANKEVKKADKPTGKAQNEATVKNIKDWKYIQPGVVPEVDGKVVFSKDIPMEGLTAQQIYDKTYVALDSLAHSGEQIKSGIALINRKNYAIVARYQEWLEFSKSFISLDRTKFNYTIMATCTDGNLNVSISRISYSYEEDRQTGFKVTAEEWIADKHAVNKKRTKLLIGPAKFRKKTIDRKDAIFAYFSEKVKQ